MVVKIFASYPKIRYAMAQVLNSAREIGYVTIPREDFYEMLKHIIYRPEDFKYLDGIKNKSDITRIIGLIARKGDIPGVKHLRTSFTDKEYCFDFDPFKNPIMLEAPEKTDISYAKKLERVGIDNPRLFTITALEEIFAFGGPNIKVTGYNEKDEKVTFWVSRGDDDDSEVKFFDLYARKPKFPINTLIRFRVTRGGNIRCVKAFYV